MTERRILPGALTRVSVAVQVSAGLQGRQGPREEAACQLFPGSEETRGPWGCRGPLATKVSDGDRGGRGQGASSRSRCESAEWTVVYGEGSDEPRGEQR